jgi:hypothetical protein
MNQGRVVAPFKTKLISEGEIIDKVSLENRRTVESKLSNWQLYGLGLVPSRFLKDSGYFIHCNPFSITSEAFPGDIVHQSFHQGSAVLVMGNNRDLEVKIEVRDESCNSIFALDAVRRETLSFLITYKLTF